jgi:23S rRNA (uracil1939-C5)-methyltransferase
MASPDELIEVRVERIGAAGDGIAHWRGRPIYIPFAAAGDRVRAVLGRRRGGGNEARVVELLAAGSGRGDPPCRHFGRCGGCALQHLGPDVYRAVKFAGLCAALERAGIDPSVVQPLRPVPPARRRARLGLVRPRDPRQPARIGFRERFRHDLVDLRECLVLEPPLFALIGALRGLVPDLLAPGAAAEASLTRTESGIDLLVAAAARPGLAALEALASLATKYDLARVVWRSQGEELPVVEHRPVRIMRSGVAVPFPPGAFLQASERAEAILVEEVLAGIGRCRPVLDLFAGLGSFALALAGVGVVHAVEGDERAAAALADAARSVPQLTVEHRDLACDPIPPAALAKYTAAVFDPPRAGAARQAAALAQSPLDAIVAVSCNPATFARDAGELRAGGFSLERVVPVDQFVWAPYLELAAVFRGEFQCSSCVLAQSTGFLQIERPPRKPQIVDLEMLGRIGASPARTSLRNPLRGAASRHARRRAMPGGARNR